jgi:hypothetical protein
VIGVNMPTKPHGAWPGELGGIIRRIDSRILEV